MKQYEELAVLEQGDDGAIVSIRGQGGPCVLLGPEYLNHLDLVLGRAIAQLHDLPKRGGVELLIAEFQTLLSTYADTRAKYEGVSGPTATKSLVEALAELKALREQLNALL
ncbi:hypothetical protein ACEN8I_03330 [Polaromonas sp. CT11-55]|uniref:hypothetical protein n=1 Tax=Polaromonas sp. CT11-55 TaxID=3243045 RepID=UPI0039A6E78B